MQKLLTIRVNLGTRSEDVEEHIEGYLADGWRVVRIAAEAYYASYVCVVVVLEKD